MCVCVYHADVPQSKLEFKQVVAFWIVYFGLVMMILIVILLLLLLAAV